MKEFLIEKASSYNRLLEFLKTYSGSLSWEDNRLLTSDTIFHVAPKYKKFLSKNVSISKETNIETLIYGKNDTQHLTAIEVIGDELWLFKNDGSIEKKKYKNWIISSRLQKGGKRLDGDLPLKYIKFYDDYHSFSEDKADLYKTGTKLYAPFDQAEGAMLLDGYTLFKGLKVNDVSVLSFDIESEGLLDDDGVPISPEPNIYLISNTFRDSYGNITKKLFALDEYQNSYEMIDDWCKWVVEVDPSILVAHNGFGYDFRYLSFMYDGELPIGKQGKLTKTASKPSKFRKDGSQSYDFNNIKIFGRHIIDTMFLAIKYDFQRNYVSYGLKQIIKQEGFEKEGRIIWDFTENPTRTVWKNRKTNPELWEKFKEYCIDDGDDALKLYDLMIPSFFYYTQSIPKTFQAINNTATGTQINSFLIRSYLQEGHSIPLASEKEAYAGAISYGNPGVYRNVYKVDVASLYPSIMIQYEVYDREKDPDQKFLKMVTYFTKERLSNKKLGKETGDRFYKDMEQAQKIVINSAYGMLGATGLNFNSPKNAAFVTSKGQEILQIGVEWACGSRFISIPKLNKDGSQKIDENGDLKTEWSVDTTVVKPSRGYSIVNVDTDSFSYVANKELTDDEFAKDLVDLNALYPSGIRWEDDGSYKTVIVVKAKNYVLDDGKKKKFKGSSLTDQKKEPALIELLHKFIDDIAVDSSNLVDIYHEYIKEAYRITDINRWVTKKTVSKAVFESDRENEKKIRDAIKGHQVHEGDKIWLFNDIDGLKQKIVKGVPQVYKKSGEPIMVDNTVLRLKEDWCGKYDTMHYIKRVYDTVKIMSNIVDLTKFIDYNKKSNGKLLKELTGDKDD